MEFRSDNGLNMGIANFIAAGAPLGTRDCGLMGFCLVRDASFRGIEKYMFFATVSIIRCRLGEV